MSILVYKTQTAYLWHIANTNNILPQLQALKHFNIRGLNWLQENFLQVY
jgi:hypothetical protein